VTVEKESLVGIDK